MMKKRILSLTLTLCLLLGLLPAPALAAEPAARGVSVSPTLTLGEAKHYQGEDLAVQIAPDQWESGSGNYAVTASGLTLRAVEGTKGTTASYLLQPFTLSLTVPARTAYTVAFKVSGTVDRGSDGSSIWFSELENSSAADKTLNTQGNVELRDGAVARAYGNSRNYRFSPAGFAYITFDNTGGTGAKTVTRDCAWLLGANKPKSVSDSYLHQMNATLTLTVDQAETRAVKAITYNPNYTDVTEADYGRQVTSDSPVTLFAAPTWTGHTFLGWKDADGEKLYAGGAEYIKDVGTLLTAQWEAIPYTVTLDYQGADGGNDTKTMTVNYSKPYGDLPTPTRAGYTFLGWGTTSGGGYQIEDNTPVYRAENHTLYAIWRSETKYIYLDSNGGDSDFWLTATGTLSAISGAKPGRTGYTFDGWYTEKTGGNEATASTSTADVGDTLYAHWTPKPYAVTLNANGGSVSPASVTATYDSAYGTLPTPSKTGYQFDGWYTAASGGDKVENGTTKVTQAANHTLYARWVKPYWTITFDAGGGYPATTTRRVDQGMVLGELPVVARTGYTLTGWSPSASADTKPNANTTYTAQWRANTYNVTYNANGGTGGSSGQVIFDQPYSGGTPTRPGYEFKGWSTSSKGDAESKCTTAKDHTVYAVWKGLTYTVNFSSNGTMLSNTKTVTPGSPYGSLPIPTNGPSGKKFMGWTVDGKLVTGATVVTKTENHTLTARWEGTHTHGVNGGDGTTKYATALTQKDFDDVFNAAKDYFYNNSSGTQYTARSRNGVECTVYRAIANKTYPITHFEYKLPAGSYYLSEPIDLKDGELDLDGRSGATTNLCLNGQALTFSYKAHIVCTSTGTINICDCKGDGSVTSKRTCLTRLLQ